jgi:hypothetical protein
VALLLSLSPSAIAKNKHHKAELSPDADIQAAEMTVGLQDQIADNVESTAPCATGMGAEEKPKKEPKQKPPQENGEIAPRSKIPLFQSREIADMEIDADFKKVMAEKKGLDTTPGKIRYRSKDGKQVSLPVEIGIRGHSKQEICEDFKPLVIHFKKEDTKGTVFEHIGDHVKLATHCSGMGSHGINEPNNQFVVREAATYQILEDNGFLSYKTRLAKMKYRDANGKPVASGMAFFLEPDGKMARRWGYKHTTNFDPIPDRGRADFLLGSQLVGAADHREGHNTTALKKDDEPVAMAFYDFDMTLLTNPTFYSKRKGQDRLRASEDIQAMNSFIQTYKDGPEAGKQFLKRALSRKEHTMNIVDKLPIKEKKFLKNRLELWYGAIENVTRGGREPATITIPQDMPQGTYSR